MRKPQDLLCEASTLSRPQCVVRKDTEINRMRNYIGYYTGPVVFPSAVTAHCGVAAEEQNFAPISLLCFPRNWVAETPC